MIIERQAGEVTYDQIESIRPEPVPLDLRNPTESLAYEVIAVNDKGPIYIPISEVPSAAIADPANYRVRYEWYAPEVNRISAKSTIVEA
jgi:hypothetical protein